MKNLFISNLNKKDVNHFTTDIGLFLRRIADKPFKKLCNIFTNANIIRKENANMSDEEYFSNLSSDYINPFHYDLVDGKNNIILERYPQLNSKESYIFVCNHTCPEDIETVLNIIDRNAYLVLGSIESLKYNKEMYLSWLNGMIPFDILDDNERKELQPKMERVIKRNSILIFPEGSHNYHPNKLINNLFDGPVNLALKTNKKIVPVTLVKDKDKNISYIDVGNPIDVNNLNINIHDYYPNAEENEKYQVKSISSYIRDCMATSVYYMLSRHIASIVRSDYENIDKYFKDKYIQEAFSGLKWKHDVFEAEYLVKKTQEEKEYEDVVRDLTNLARDEELYYKTFINLEKYLEKEQDLDNKNVVLYMREYWKSLQIENQEKKLIKKRAA